jgi:hypothetical protein
MQIGDEKYLKLCRVCLLTFGKENANVEPTDAEISAKIAGPEFDEAVCAAQSIDPSVTPEDIREFSRHFIADCRMNGVFKKRVTTDKNAADPSKSLSLQEGVAQEIRHETNITDGDKWPPR